MTNFFTDDALRDDWYKVINYPSRDITNKPVDVLRILTSDPGLRVSFNTCKCWVHVDWRHRLMTDGIICRKVFDM